jgi:hypothetical protein
MCLFVSHMCLSVSNVCRFVSYMCLFVSSISLCVTYVSLCVKCMSRCVIYVSLCVKYVSLCHICVSLCQMYVALCHICVSLCHICVSLCQMYVALCHICLFVSSMSLCVTYVSVCVKHMSLFFPITLFKLIPYYFLLRKFNFIHTEEGEVFVGLLGCWTSSIIRFPKNEHNEGENSFGNTAHRQSSGNSELSAEIAISILWAVLGNCVPHDNVCNSVSRDEVLLKLYSRASPKDSTVWYYFV